MRHEFSRVPGNTGRTDLDKCDKILAQRIEAKRANDYEVADKLRDQLRRDLGVEVMDRERLWWSVNGERGQMPQFKASSHDYRREDNLDGVDIESINAILAQRLQARITRDFATADQLRDRLRRMGVEVDDKARSFTCLPSAQGSGGGGGGGGGGGRGRSGSRSASPRRGDSPRNDNGGDRGGGGRESRSRSRSPPARRDDERDEAEQEKDE